MKNGMTNVFLTFPKGFLKRRYYFTTIPDFKILRFWKICDNVKLFGLIWSSGGVPSGRVCYQQGGGATPSSCSSFKCCTLCMSIFHSGDLGPTRLWWVQEAVWWEGPPGSNVAFWPTALLAPPSHGGAAGRSHKYWVYTSIKQLDIAYPNDSRQS